MKLTILLLYLFIHLSKNEQFIEVPKSQVIMKGTSTTLNCTVESDGYTKWTLSRKSGELTISHDDSVAQNLRQFFWIKKLTRKASQVSYNLKIVNVTMNLSGVYTCHLTKSKAMASLSVMNMSVCTNKQSGFDIVFSCSYEFSGAFNFTPSWSPKDMLHTTRTSYKTIKYNNYEIIQCNTATRMRRTELVQCNCTIKTDRLLYFYFSFGIQTEVNPPIFKKVLAPISKIKINVTNGNSIYRTAFLTCMTDSNLQVEYNLEFRSVNYRNVTSFTKLPTLGIPPTISLMSVVCKASNGLNPTKVRTVLDNIQISAVQISCQDTAWNCVKDFYNIIFSKKLPQEDIEKHKQFCIDSRAALYCLFRASKCKSKRKTFLLANILIAYCIGEFGKLRYMSISLEERFPHTIAQKYLHHQRLLGPMNTSALPYIDRELYEGYCTRLEFSAYTIAEVGFSLAVGKFDSEKWLQTFFEASVGAKIENYRVIYTKEDGTINHHKTITNCIEHDGKNYTTCGLYLKCISVHVEMLNLYHYGFVFVKDTTGNFWKAISRSSIKLQTKPQNTKEPCIVADFMEERKNFNFWEKLFSVVCDLSERYFGECQEMFLSRCNPYIQALTYPFIRMRRFLCDIKHMKFYFKYRECYRKLEGSIQSSLSTYENTPLFHCASLYRGDMEELLYGSKKPMVVKKDITCAYTKRFLDCLEKKIQGVCKEQQAAKIQRSLARMTVYYGLGEVECRRSFLHYDLELFASSDHTSFNIYLTISMILSIF